LGRILSFETIARIILHLVLRLFWLGSALHSATAAISVLTAGAARYGSWQPETAERERPHGTQGPFRSLFSRLSGRLGSRPSTALCELSVSLVPHTLSTVLMRTGSVETVVTREVVTKYHPGTPYHTQASQLGAQCAAAAVAGLMGCALLLCPPGLGRGPSRPLSTAHPRLPLCMSAVLLAGPYGVIWNGRMS
jgi:hypothetical protein